MAKILVVGGGFAGVVTAESLAKKLGSDHQITLVSRSRKFLFYPALVRLAFGRCEPDDVTFDLRVAMLDRRIQFVEGEVARINPYEHHVTLAHGDLVGDMPYDYLVLALGRRLATERVTGFFEHAHHLLDLDGTFRFSKAIKSFHQGRAVIGHCPGARLPVPAFETAFALSRLLEESNQRDQCAITIASDESLDEIFGGVPVSDPLRHALGSRGIEFVSGFAIHRVTPTSVVAKDGRMIDCELRILIPPFSGPGPVIGTGITDADGYIQVDSTMKVRGHNRTYAVGDCLSFPGPKMGHMAVRQGEVAAENLAAEIGGRPLSSTYDHELMLVLEAGDGDSIFVHKDLWTDDPASVSQNRFWSWAKRIQEQYWKARHD
jgi:NADH dehydrogenase FAD-containing subunit